MLKRKRAETEIEYAETEPQESDDSMQELSFDDGIKNKQHQKMKAAPRSSKFKFHPAISKQKERDKGVSIPSVDLTLAFSDSSENSDELNSVPSQLTPNNKDLQSLLSLSSSCKEHLMCVVSTAIQFQRHSHQQKLCSSHFSKALALHDFILESDDPDDFEDLNYSESTSENISKETEK